MKLLVLLFIFPLSLASVRHSFMEEWTLWKKEHGKDYSTDEDEQEKFAVWLENKDYIKSHNLKQDSLGFTLSLNQFADMVSITCCSHWL